ncbi:MAG: M48 family metalloprotease [Acidobacteria bacterium]|nr:M48 family metalloprotease [Acidobacteriota bacterium]
MNWSFLELGMSNAVISLLIALVAVFVGRLTNRPHLAHLLWLLVLVKLLMPAVIPVSYDLFPERSSDVSAPAPAQIDLSEDTGSEVIASQITNMPPVDTSSILPAIITLTLAALPIIWGLGILAAIALSLFRVMKFDRLLRSSSENASDAIYRIAEDLAGRLSLKKLPSISITNAAIAPMVWWVGGNIRVFIPASLVENMQPDQLRLVLAHELAHVKRRDFLVRWVEWLAGVLFWWNPVVWWAQRNVRANEELCCDSLVLTALKPKPGEYAESLLRAVEHFTESAYRPPAMASEVNSGGYLIRRINMILSGNNKQELKRKMQIAVLAAAALVLPLGLTFAQDKDSEADLRQKIEAISKDVKEGRKSKAEAQVEIAEIKRDIEIQTAKRKLNGAVEAGKLSAEDAAKKLEAIERSLSATKNRSNEGLKMAIEKVEAAQSEGKISKEEAEKRIQELKLNFVQQAQATKFKLAAEKLKMAVKANQISEAEANAKLIGLKRELAERAVSIDRLRAAEKLKLAVRDGKISKEDAERKLIELQGSIRFSNETPDLKLAAEKLEQAVKANKISQEVAKRLLEAIKSRLADRENNSELTKEMGDLKRALGAGEISKAEVARRVIELKKQRDLERSKLQLENAKKKIESAVSSGSMTEAEAKAKLLELEKQLKSKKDN